MSNRQRVPEPRTPKSYYRPTERAAPVSLPRLACLDGATDELPDTINDEPLTIETYARTCRAVEKLFRDEHG